MKLAITYWQSAKYSMTVDADEVLPALRDYLSEGGMPDAEIGGIRVADVIADLEAGRDPSDNQGLIALVLDEDGQFTVSEGTEPDEWDAPGDYTVEVLPE